MQRQHGPTTWKIIIFARNHQHAVLIRQMFEEGAVKRTAPSVKWGRVGRSDDPPAQTQDTLYRVNSSPEVIRLVVMMYVQFPLSLRNVEDLLYERRIDLCLETVRL